MLPSVFSKKESKDKARELLEKVGLQKRLSHLPGQLSGGEMQRVAIARSMIHNPSMLLADEPTGNLDSKNTEKIMNVLTELCQQGTSLVMVTHNDKLAEKNGRIIRMEDGQVV